jgi:hypothetical protein
MTSLVKDFVNHVLLLFCCCCFVISQIDLGTLSVFEPCNLSRNLESHPGKLSFPLVIGFVRPTGGMCKIATVISFHKLSFRIIYRLCITSKVETGLSSDRETVLLFSAWRSKTHVAYRLLFLRACVAPWRGASCGNNGLSSCSLLLLSWELHNLTLFNCCTTVCKCFCYKARVTFLWLTVLYPFSVF